MIRKRAVFSWALYDLGNTIFSMNIVSFYFSLWVVNVMGAGDAAYADANALSMAIIFVLSPLLGALTDQAGRRLPFLFASTAICVGFTLLLGSGSVGASLVYFVIANIGYQAGLQFYDALLPEVSTEENRGRVSGLGVGLGYVGSFIGVLVARQILLGVDALPQSEQIDRYRSVFRITALLFLIFALPCFIFVRERARRAARLRLATIAAAARQVAETLRSSRRYPGLARFLGGRVFYTDAVNTVIAMMGIYVTNEVGFTTGEAQLIMLIAIAFAVVGGFAWGRAVDRSGPKRTLDRVLYVWMVVFVWTALVGFLDLPKEVFWPVPVLAGIGLGGTWAADRILLLRLTPPARVGEFYGLYGMVSRFSAVMGPFLWARIVDTLGWGRPVAITTLLVFVVIGYLILRPVSDAPRTWSGADTL